MIEGRLLIRVVSLLETKGPNQPECMYDGITEPKRSHDLVLQTREF